MTGQFVRSTEPLEDIVRNPQTREDQSDLLTAAVTTRIFTARENLPEFRRLIVLVPNAEIDQDAHLPQRIWQLASPGKTPVLYLTAAGDYELEMGARRRLSLLAAITRDKRVPVEIQVAHTSNWVQALKSIVQPGDLILSDAGLTARKGLFGSEALSDQLSRSLSVPVFLLSGYAYKEPEKTPHLLRLFLSGALLGLILVGFSRWMNRSPANWWGLRSR